jgi:hypothetical protein
MKKTMARQARQALDQPSLTKAFDSENGFCHSPASSRNSSQTENLRSYIITPLITS